MQFHVVCLSVDLLSNFFRFAFVITVNILKYLYTRSSDEI